MNKIRESNVKNGEKNRRKNGSFFEKSSEKIFQKIFLQRIPIKKSKIIEAYSIKNEEKIKNKQSIYTKNVVVKLTESKLKIFWRPKKRCENLTEK